jgi:hypothetical protein
MNHKKLGSQKKKEKEIGLASYSKKVLECMRFTIMS